MTPEIHHRVKVLISFWWDKIFDSLRRIHWYMYLPSSYVINKRNTLFSYTFLSMHFDPDDQNRLTNKREQVNSNSNTTWAPMKIHGSRAFSNLMALVRSISYLLPFALPCQRELSTLSRAVVSLVAGELARLLRRVLVLVKRSEDWQGGTNLYLLEITRDQSIPDHIIYCALSRACGQAYWSLHSTTSRFIFYLDLWIHAMKFGVL